MFRFLSLIGILLSFVWLVYALRSNSLGLKAVGQRLYRAGQNIIISIFHLKSLSSKDFSSKLLFPLTLLCICIMALTGFLQPIVFGKHLSGYLLIIHVATSPLFALCIVTLGLLLAHQHKFDITSWEKLQNLFSKEKKQNTQSVDFWQKLGFWLMLLLTIPIIFSIVSSMYKIFGTHGQEFLLQLHRYSTLSFVMITVIFTFYYRVRTQKSR